LLTPIILGLVMIVQVVIAYLSPQTILGKWKERMYKEKLEGDAFRAHLDDYSQLKKYSTEDLSMWGSWLVYGTALGLGEQVAQAMKELNIQLSPTVATSASRTHYTSVRAASISSGGGGGSGGGHKGGGGHRG
jgi:uncharacterized membrane protein